MERKWLHGCEPLNKERSVMPIPNKQGEKIRSILLALQPSSKHREHGPVFCVRRRAAISPLSQKHVGSPYLFI
jgi:hypothetical protein